MTITHPAPTALSGDRNPAVLALVATALAEEAARGPLDLAELDEQCAIVGLCSRRLAARGWDLDRSAARGNLAAVVEHDQRAAWLMDAPAARRHAAAIIARHATPRMDPVTDEAIARMLADATPLTDPQPTVQQRLDAVLAVLDRLESDADMGRLDAAGAWVVQQVRAAAERGEHR